jgi:hypothetical protein
MIVLEALVVARSVASPPGGNLVFFGDLRDIL